MTNTWKLVFIFLIASLFLAFYATFQILDDKLHIVVCDVGQGDGILIYHKSTQIVVDSGPDDKILNCLAEHMPFWDREIELTILTNPDLDHYGGFTEIFKRYKVDLFESPGIEKSDETFKVLQKTVKEYNVQNKVLAQGDVLKLGNIMLTAQWPTKDYLAENPNFTEENIGDQKVLGASTESVNKWSEVTLLTYGAFKTLLTGDVQNPATDTVATVNVGAVSVLKVPHHGSKNGLTENLLISVTPALAIISAGDKNRYGHPHSETIEMLKKFGINTMCTCWGGEVEVVTDGKTWSVGQKK